ncbi:thiopurine S-methyltransferase [Alteromonas sp. H39]|uniref:thiopurine S-methyltransferase n=1 Tax=Alteromonas sp. H39 TaxID=3389876 RepID=UPI0039E09E67
MEHDFWISKWQNNEIAFHEAQGNPYLVKHHGFLSSTDSPRVFVPLCGKTRDIHYLLSQGYDVVAAELSELAITQLFEELGELPEITQDTSHKRYHIPGLTVFVGDFFALTAKQIGDITSVYDRAALIALPDTMRVRYTQQLMSLTNKARQFLICVDYDQTVMPGPPFATPEDTVRSLYEAHYTVTRCESEEIEGGLKGKVEAKNDVYYLTPR